MLSTAQAVKEWDTVLKLLNEARSHAAAHPDQQTLPEGLEARMARSVYVLNERSRGLASPHATWKQMLKQKVGTAASWQVGCDRLPCYYGVRSAELHRCLL
jgi:hypothetical protein